MLIVNENNSVPVIINEPTKTTSSAIHIHNGYNTWVAGTPMSEGCLILHPSDWTLDEEVPLGAPAIYRNIRRWLESIGIKLGKTPAPATAAAEPSAAEPVSAS